MSVGKPGYFCIGRKRYGCTHGYCHECFWKKVKEIDELEQGKTSSLRQKSNRINGWKNTLIIEINTQFDIKFMIK